MENQAQLLDDLMRIREKYEKEVSGVSAALEQVRAEAYKEGHSARR
ncbi:MAG: hypothetical protein JRJ83_16535 [Deltaproteobacteria bacterium]|nr:hypothetical protein [Deltaproteobacteria bacterium]MBW1921677.1 hypothetical protein [Deltaproteobacteria bacterium]MBW1933517.1 hypothetical protein [Deltaproteobacteria bacterium]